MRRVPVLYVIPRLALLSAATACHSSLPPGDVPAPAAVAEQLPAGVLQAALTDARARRWDQAVTWVDSASLSKFAEVVIDQARRIQQMRSAGTMPGGSQAAWDSVNNRPYVSPVLFFTRAGSLTDLEQQPPSAILTAMLTQLDSLIRAQARPPAMSPLLVDSTSFSADTIAAVYYHLGNEEMPPALFIHRGQGWRLRAEGALGLFLSAAYL